MKTPKTQTLKYDDTLELANSVLVRVIGVECDPRSSICCVLVSDPDVLVVVYFDEIKGVL